MLDLLNGVGGFSIVYACARVATGAFFAISGAHKLLSPTRHATLVATLERDHIPLVRYCCWFVPSVELLGGLGVMAGFLTPLAAIGLLCICLVATCTDGLGRIVGWKPMDSSDYVDDVLYLPEVVYILLLLLFVAAGAGPYSIDRALMELVG